MDSIGHLGGLITGIVLSLALIKPDDASKFVTLGHGNLVEPTVGALRYWKWLNRLGLLLAFGIFASGFTLFFTMRNPQ